VGKALFVGNMTFFILPLDKVLKFFYLLSDLKKEILGMQYCSTDVRAYFGKIDKRITMLYSDGSVEVQEGKYTDKEKTLSLEKNLKTYNFGK